MIGSGNQKWIRVVMLKPLSDSSLLLTEKIYHGLSCFHTHSKDLADGILRTLSLPLAVRILLEN